MRLHRICVEDFKGIEHADVALTSPGVTIIRAPNEAGKSSLFEAVRLLLEVPDSSLRREVRAVQPVGRDVPSTVEVTLSCGPYTLTCLKRFNRQQATELTITSPAREHLTGREAHDRLRAILDEHVDEALRQAVWFDQGTSLQHPQLEDSPSLIAALDRVAGGRADTQADDLYSRARDYAAQWYTDGGRPRASLTDLAAAVDQLEATVATLTKQRDLLARDITRSVEVAQRLGVRRNDLRAAQTRDEQLRAAANHIVELRAAVEDRARDVQACARTHEDAERAVAERAELREEIAGWTRRVNELTDDVATAQPAAEQLTERLTDLRAERDRCAAALKEARAVAAARTAAYDLVTEQADLAALQQRRKTIEDADRQAAEDEGFLASCPLSPARLAEVDAADDAYRLTEAQLAAGAPQLTVEALAPFELRTDEGAIELAAGGRWQGQVADPRTVEIGEVARVQVQPGASLAELTEARDHARQRLEAACASVGVADRAAAHALDTRRRAALARLAERDSLVQRVLDGQGREELDAAIRRLEASVAARRASSAAALDARDRQPTEPAGPTEPPEPSSPAVARQQREEAERTVRAAEAATTQAEAALAALAPDAQAARERLIAAHTRLSGAEEQLAAAQQRLSAARKQRADEDLSAARDEAAEAWRTAERAHAAAREALSEANPEQVEALAAQSGAACARISEELRTLELEDVTLQERLRTGQVSGIDERVEAARADLTAATSERDRAARRAAAAKRLFDALDAARSAAREAYRAPLRSRVEQLGRVVFGPGFSVEIGEDLAVATRTLDGSTVPWEQLSGGAKEQLAIVTALAAGLLVGEPGQAAGPAAAGVPIVLDDALGFTDPQRLTTMGALLAAVGETNQVIVLTCTPERYDGVGRAELITLKPERAGASETPATAP